MEETLMDVRVFGFEGVAMLTLDPQIRYVVLAEEGQGVKTRRDPREDGHEGGQWTEADP